MVQFHSSACGCPIFPAPFIEETVLFPVDSLSCFCRILVDHKVEGPFLGSLSCSIDIRVCFCAVPHCLDDHSFVVQLENQHCDAPGSGFLFQYSPGYSGSFLIPHKSFFKVFFLIFIYL